MNIAIAVTLFVFAFASLITSFNAADEGNGVAALLSILITIWLIYAGVWLV